MTLDEVLTRAGVEITHHFAGGAYIKETVIPAGVALEQHTHSHAHLGVLLEGTVVVTAGKDDTVYDGPNIVHLPAGIAHRIGAVTAARWLCVWGTDETDPARVDQAIINKDHA